MLLGTPIALGPNAAVSRQQAAALYAEATVLNDLTPTSTPATNALDPYTGSASGGARRRRPFIVAGRTVQSDLVEGSRQNITTHSQDITQAAWTTNNIASVNRDRAAPDGTLTGGRITINALSGSHSVGNVGSSITSGTTYTISAYLKANTVAIAQVFGSLTAFGANVWANFDLTNGVVGSVGSLATASIAPAGNGWFRCSVTGAAVSTTTGGIAAGFIQSLTDGRAPTFTGNGTDSFLFWGAQVEAAVFPSSYIVTGAAAVTRGADSLSVSLASLSGGGLSTTAGTILALAVPYGWTGDQDGSTAYRIFAGTNCLLARTSATQVRATRVDGGGNQTTDLTHGFVTRTIRGVAMVYDGTSVRGYVDGVASGTPDTTLTPAYLAQTSLLIGSDSGVQHMFGYVALLYWPRALTAAEIATISRECGLAGIGVL